MSLFTINYYDDYDFDSISQGTLIPATVYNQPVTNATKMLPTGSYVRVLDTDDWIVLLNAYDDKARAIYNYTADDYTEYTQTVKNKLDFMGVVTESNTTHSKKTMVTLGENTSFFWVSTSIDDYFTYDRMHRLLTHTQKENGKAHEELIVSKQYDELGTLIQKKVGGTAGATYTATAGLQTVDYSYNIRGWLKGINGTDDNLRIGSDLFGFTINYNTTTLNNATALYNGNIAETHWKTRADDQLRSYAYQYDTMNRLTDANYDAPYTLPNNPLAQENYTEGNIEYDKNGNIKLLERYGFKGYDQMDKIDDLAYQYEPYSNKLSSVTDNGYQEGFTDGNKTGNDYQYDANGNMTRDLNKNIANIRYNHLNLPQFIEIDSDHHISYIYTATGQKLQKNVNDGQNTVITQYNGGFVYQQSGDGQNTLQFFPTEEGYVTKDVNGDFAYIYQYKDHLGNIRLSYADSDKDGIISDTQKFYSDFETTAGWETGQLVYDNTHSFSGQYSGKIVNDSYEPAEVIVHTAQPIKINNSTDTQYKLSARVYSNGPEVQLYLLMKEAGETGYSTQDDQILTGVVGQWKYITKTITVPASMRELIIRLDNNGKNSGYPGNTVWFDEVKLERVDGQSEIIEENHYYAFGLKHKGYNLVVSPDGNGAAQKYKYNGKELQGELNLNLYDYGARNYDPALGRWFNIDPLAETSRRYSPYSYALDNPIYFIDPDGMKAESVQSGVYYDWDEKKYINTNTGDEATFEDAIESHGGENAIAKKGKAIIIAFPEKSAVIPTNQHSLSWIERKFGDGDGEVNDAGHAGIVIIDEETGLSRYFDFGRYDRSDLSGKRGENQGSVRSSKNFSQLKIPNWDFSVDDVQNVNNILKSLKSSKLFTGYGTIMGTLIEDLDYNAMLTYATTIENQGYHSFGGYSSSTNVNNATYCAKFVRGVAGAGGFDWSFYILRGRANVKDANNQEGCGIFEIKD